MVTRVLDDTAGLGSTVPDPTVLGMFRRTADRLFSEGEAFERRSWEMVATGFASLDRLLPAGGVRRGSIIEWRACGGDVAGDAGGAISLACAVACRLAVATSAGSSSAGPRRSGHSQASTIVVVDRGQRFYAPSVIPWIEARTISGMGDVGTHDGVTGDFRARESRRPQLVVARPARDDDELWTIDQSLRCPGVAAVLAWPRRVHATAMRRWQLATRASGAVGLLFRGLSERRTTGKEPVSSPTWADAKLAITPLAGDVVSDLAVRHLRVSLSGGPWSVGEMLQKEMSQERSTDVLLDLTNGREASCYRRQIRPAVPVVGKHQQVGRLQLEDVTCHAS